MIALFWNEQQRRIRTFWRLLCQTMFFFSLTTLGSLLWGVVSGMVMVFQGTRDLEVITTRLSLSTGSLGFFTASIVWSLLVMVLGAWILGFALDRRPLREFGFHFSRSWWRDFGFGLFLGALLMSGIFAVELWRGWVKVGATMVSFEPGMSFPAALGLYVVLYLAVGVYEELMSRGYLLRNLAEGLVLPVWGPRGAVLLAWLSSSVVFGLLHMGNPNAGWISSANIALAGIFLGLGYVITGELALSIGLHIAWNFFQGVVYGFPVSGMAPQAAFLEIQQSGPVAWTGGAFGPEGGLVGVLAILIGCGLIVLWFWRTGRLALRTELAIWQPQENGPQQETLLPSGVAE